MPRILVADDDAGISVPLTDLLEGEWFDVSKARTGSDVLSHVDKAESPDLNVMDVRVPEMTGIDVLRCLRVSRVGAGAAVVTVFNTSNLAIQSTQMGACWWRLRGGNRRRWYACRRRARVPSREGRARASSTPA